jgi:hypothetical protein
MWRSQKENPFRIVQNPLVFDVITSLYKGLSSQPKPKSQALGRGRRSGSKRCTYLFDDKATVTVRNKHQASTLLLSRLIVIKMYI